MRFDVTKQTALSSCVKLRPAAGPPDWGELKVRKSRHRRVNISLMLVCKCVDFVGHTHIKHPNELP